jgi:hypothetical protein
MSGPEFERDSFAPPILAPQICIVVQEIIICHKEEASLCSCTGAGTLDACFISDYQLFGAGTLVDSAALDHCNSILFRCDIYHQHLFLKLKLSVSIQHHAMKA